MYQTLENLPLRMLSFSDINFGSVFEDVAGLTSFSSILSEDTFKT
jgi:hypothetical protein